MATNPSLFGYLGGDEAAMQRQLDEERAVAASKRTLDEQLGYMASKAGTGIGRTLAGMFGADTTDPELARRSLRNKLITGFDASSDASASEGIKALRAAGFADEANQIEKTYLENAKTRADIKKTGAEATKFEGEAAGKKARVDALVANGVSQKEAEAIASSDTAFSNYVKSKKVETNNEQAAAARSLNIEAKPYLSDYSQSEMSKILDKVQQNKVDVARAGRQTTINQAESTYAQTVGKEQGMNDITLIRSAEAAAKTLPKLYETRKLVETGDVNTGLGRAITDAFNKAKSTFIADQKAGKNVSDSQYLDSLLGSSVFAQLQDLGLGAKNIDTPAEREFMREVIAGTRDLNKDTIQRMVDSRVQAAETSLGKYNENLGAGKFDQYQKITQKKLDPLSAAKDPYETAIQLQLAANAKQGVKASRQQVIEFLKSHKKL